MKKILNILMAALVLTGISCSEDLEYKPGGVTPVQTLLLPADNYYVELQSASTATLRFSWEPALAADGQLPHYEVVFFGKPGGEIIYRCDAGSSTSVDIVHKEINRIANAAGIDVGADGAVYWSVVSSRGVDTAPVVATPRRLELTRLLGFNVIPDQLFLTGEATEGGSDLENAWGTVLAAAQDEARTAQVEKALQLAKAAADRDSYAAACLLAAYEKDKAGAAALLTDFRAVAAAGLRQSPHAPVQGIAAQRALRLAEAAIQRLGAQVNPKIVLSVFAAKFRAL